MAHGDKAFKAFNLVLEAWGDSDYRVHPEWVVVAMGQEQFLGLQKIAGAAKNWQAMMTTTPGIIQPRCVQFDASVASADPKWVVLEEGASVLGSVTFAKYAVTGDGIQYVGEMKPGKDDPDECLSWPLNLEDVWVALDNRVEGARHGNLLWVTPDTLVASSLVESDTLEELQKQAALVLSIAAQNATAAAA